MNSVLDNVDNYILYKNVESVLIESNIDDQFRPQVSIVMPVYNPDLSFFRKAVLSAENQNTNYDYDIIIVDNDPYDGKENAVEELVRSLKLKHYKYFRNRENLGMTGNWNRCVELSDAPVLVYCHADDELLPNCIDTLMMCHQVDPKCMVAAAFNTINENEEFINKIDANKTKWHFLKKRKYWKYSLFDLFSGGIGFGCGCLFEKDKMLKLGGFNNEFYPSADYALFINYAYHYGLIYSEIPTFNYRKAVNESFKVWPEFIKRDHEFRNMMMPEIKFPKKFLKNYDNALANNAKHFMAISWGKEREEDAPPVSEKDKRLVHFVEKIKNIRTYQLSI